MLYFLSLILVLIVFIDILFYVPIKIHIYNDSHSFYLFCYSLPIIKIDNNTNLNLLENKISLDNIYSADNMDLQIMNHDALK